MFELRMMFYEHYPDYAKEEYIDVKSLIKKFDKKNTTSYIILGEKQNKKSGRVRISL